MPKGRSVGADVGTKLGAGVGVSVALIVGGTVGLVEIVGTIDGRGTGAPLGLSVM